MRPPRRAGFTLVELAIALVLIGILAAMAFPVYINALTNARVARAIGDIRSIEKDIVTYELGNGQVPPTLAAVGLDALLDPWKHPYEYLDFSGEKGKGNMRKDKFLVPINTTFDLYSMGKDGKTKTQLNVQEGRDDIVRANDGAYVGLAAAY